ncbi:MAG TPA: pilus assembly protein TadG-related protein [Hyphomicrobiaceae bacterium]|nr:pilus assembly protein TadG-related protein [Hyphomicrobiaceae bacterium]
MPALFWRTSQLKELCTSACPVTPVRHVSGFVRNESGNVVLIFAALLLPLVAISIGAMDYGRANTARHHLQTAIDAGLSFAVKHALEDEVNMNAAFQRAFKANLPDAMKSAQATFHANMEGAQLEAEASLPVSAHVLGILNANRIVVAARGSTRITIPEQGVPSSKQLPGEAARPVEPSQEDIEATKSRIRALLGNQLPNEPFSTRDSVDPAEAERLAHEILQQLGQ